MKKHYSVIINNDKSYDGLFYYGVKTTKIFCKPSCNSKNPKLENTVIFDTKNDAIKSGYRPCKRCRPDLFEFTPLKDLTVQVKKQIDKSLDIKKLDVGLSISRVRELFREEYGITLKQYEKQVRIKRAKQLIQENISVLKIADLLHYKSTSGFYSFFKKETGKTPIQYRRDLKNDL